jgi:hypothetical protein
MKWALYVGDYRTLNVYFRNMTVVDYGGACKNPVQEAQRQPDLAKRCGASIASSAKQYLTQFDSCRRRTSGKGLVLNPPHHHFIDLSRPRQSRTAGPSRSERRSEGLHLWMARYSSVSDGFSLQGSEV